MLVKERTRFQYAIAALLVVGFALLVFGRAMDRDLNHDEHQFIAPGVLLAREGLLPYLDYPLFHLPNLTFLYALSDLMFANLIVSTKLFSALSTILVGVLLALVCWRGCRHEQRSLALNAIASLLALMFFDPLFDFTIGKTWNHEVPTLCLVMALVMAGANVTRDKIWLAVVTGIAAGIAAGTRLTFVTVAAPVCLLPVLYGLFWKRRWQLVMASCAGFLFAMIPTIWLCVKAPEAFWFDNFQFPRLRLMDASDGRVQKTATFWRKIRFFFKEVVLPSWPLFLAYVLVGLPPAIRWFRERSRELLPAAFVLLALPLALAGCFTPSRYQYQHYYLFVPLLALGIACGVSFTGRKSGKSVALILSVLALINIGVAASERSYRWVRTTFKPSAWYASDVQEMAEQLRQKVSSGKILTLAPTLPLEAGLSIYPELATGPFGWRAAHLIDPAKRGRLKFLAPEDLSVCLEKDPPAGILTGYEKEDLERPLIEYAKANGFQPVQLYKKRTLWLKST